MKNLSKKLEYIISIIVILILISLTMKTCSQNNTIREKDLLINSLNDTVKIWKDKQNISHTKSQIIETSNIKDFLEIFLSGIFSIFVYLSEILWIKPYGKDV